MTTDYQGATDDIFGQVKKTNDSKSLAILGYIPELRYTPEQKNTPPDATKVWARVSIQTVDEGQSTFGTCGDIPGQRLYKSVGLVFVQVFIPKSTGAVGSKLRLLAAMFRNGFRGVKTDNGVWFRNATIKELPDEDTYFRFNVTTEFEYSEIF